MARAMIAWVERRRLGGSRGESLSPRIEAPAGAGNQLMAGLGRSGSTEPAAAMRAMKRALALALVLAAGASCGGNDEDKRVFAQRRDLCDGLVAKGETVGQVKADFQATGLNGPTALNGVSCQQFVTPDKSTCQAGQVTCKIFWQTVALDSSLCNVNSCVYACIAYVSAQNATDATADSAIVCGTQFVSGQPFPF